MDKTKRIREFDKYVDQIFSFLNEEFGFSKLAPKPEQRVFLSGHIKLDVSIGGRFFNRIGCQISHGQIQDTQEFTLSEICKFEKLEKYTFRSSEAMVHDPVDIPDCLEHMARAIRDIYDPYLLSKNKDSFLKISDFVKEKSTEITKRYTNGHSIRQADQMWKDKNFEQVVQILSPIETHLDATEKRRLKFAIKKIS